MVVNRFYENVNLHNVEGRELADGEKEQNVRLEFAPRPEHDVLAACLWSHWTPPAGSDEPPPKVAAAGHDRYIIPIKPGNVDA